MAYHARSGDIISLDNPKAGALTLSVPVWDYRTTIDDPGMLWHLSYALRSVTYYIARKVAAVPMHLYERRSDTDRARVTTTPLAHALQNPVAGRGWSRFAEQLVLDMSVYDRYAAVIVPEDEGRVSFRRLPAHRIAVEMLLGEPQSVVVYADYDVEQTSEPEALVKIPLDRVVFDVGASAYVHRYDRGDSRIITLAGLLAELDETSSFRREIAQNGPRIPATIERPVDAPKWNDESWTRFKTSFAQYSVGGGAEGGVPILEDGMKLVGAEFLKPDDASSTTSLRRIALEEAAILYGIPPELIGVRQGNYSNLQALREMEYVDVLGGWVTNLQDALNIGCRAAGLLADDEYVEANVEARLRGAFESQAEVLSTSVGAPWLTRNEARARMNLPRVDGGDELITPLNVVVGGQASPRDGKSRDYALSVEPKAVAAHVKAVERTIDDPSWRMIYVTLDAFERALVDYARDVHSRIVTRADDVRREGLKAAERRVKASALTSYVLDPELLKWLLAQHTTQIAGVSAEQVLALWDTERISGWSASRLDGWIAFTSKERAKAWSTSLAQQVNSLVLQDDPKAWEQFIADVDAFSPSARVHAQSWGTENVEFARHDAALASGLDTKTWRTTSPNPRASHSLMNGSTVAIDEEFPNGMKYPGDWAGGPEEVANCHCTVEYSRAEQQE